MFRGERQGHPPGDRPRRNRQDRTRRRGRHRRCETNAPAAHPKDPLRRAQGLDRRVPRLRQSRIRGGRPQGDPPGRRPHPHGRGRRYRSACLRQRRGAGDRRRAAADVRGALFRVPPQPQPGNFGRSRHDGLRASGRHRRQTGRPRPRGMPLRGRRRAADDHPGAGDDLPVAGRRKDRIAQQLLSGHGTAAWSGARSWPGRWPR